MYTEEGKKGKSFFTGKCKSRVAMPWYSAIHIYAFYPFCFTCIHVRRVAMGQAKQKKERKVEMRSEKREGRDRKERREKRQGREREKREAE